MAHLFLPVEHSESDLVLAGQIAERIESAELYVAWTPENGHCAPAVAAELRAPGSSRRGPLGFLAAVVRELWDAVRHSPRQPIPAPASYYEQPRTGPAA